MTIAAIVDCIEVYRLERTPRKTPDHNRKIQISSLKANKNLKSKATVRSVGKKAVHSERMEIVEKQGNQKIYQQAKVNTRKKK